MKAKKKPGSATARDHLLKEIEGVPGPLLQEVVDFVRFLKAKGASGRMETALLSERSLARDWLRPEEDEAWSGL